MCKSHTLAALLLSSWLCLPAPAGTERDGRDWPQWRGTDRNGLSTEIDWSSTGSSEPLWRKQLGFGHSSFAISDGRLFTLGYDLEAKVDVVYCLDPTTGEEIWSHRYPSEYWDNSHDGGTITTPAVDGDVVYTSNREGKLFCFDVATGEIRWSRDLQAELEIEPPTWGFSASPLLIGDVIYMNLGRVAAINKTTGEDIWVTDKNYGNAYSTPAAFEHQGKAFLAVLCGSGLVVINQTTGEEIAFHGWSKTPEIFPMTPLVMGDRIFISAGYTRGCSMLRLAGNELELLWESKVMRNKMTGSVLWMDHLYGFDESILKCIDLDGKEQWRKRGLGAGSLILAGGRLVIVDAKGEVVIVEATPEKYTELSRQKFLTGGGSFWTLPVLSHGLIYCRSGKGEMACLDFRTGATLADTTLPRSADSLPSPRELFARHLEASGGIDALKRITSVHFYGSSDALFETVQSGTSEIIWDVAAGFSWTTESGFQYAHHDNKGWITVAGSAPHILKPESLEPVLEVGNIHRFIDSVDQYQSLRRVQVTSFDNRECYKLEITGEDDHERTLYFDVQSGLFAGEESESEPMLVLADYRDVDGVMLPMTWSYYDPDTGAMLVATFDRVELNETIDASA
ncbi:MAG: PQQ-binding-like beta-propeller repeat protein, partial [Planctomycetes bacterium]|nr:PQQ-binding-like beta-propeller repeat protein [Planctomycetota bacterium]